jgi:hypothetical protein
MWIQNFEIARRVENTGIQLHRSVFSVISKKNTGLSPH